MDKETVWCEGCKELKPAEYKGCFKIGCPRKKAFTEATPDLSDGEYLTFVEDKERRKDGKRKTKLIYVNNKISGSQLGVIAWHGGFRKYAFGTVPALGEIVFDANCLKDISRYLEQLMLEYKQLKAANPEDKFDKMDREALKEYNKVKELGVLVKKSMEDEEVREAVRLADKNKEA